MFLHKSCPAHLVKLCLAPRFSEDSILNSKLSSQVFMSRHTPLALTESLHIHKGAGVLLHPGSFISAWGRLASKAAGQSVCTSIMKGASPTERTNVDTCEHKGRTSHPHCPTLKSPSGGVSRRERGGDKGRKRAQAKA